MNVDKIKTVIIDSEHSIEFGESSWKPTEKSVRRRKNHPSGKFNPYSSSEIPVNGHVAISDLIVECLKNDYIDKIGMTKILNNILESCNRQGCKIEVDKYKIM